MAKNLEPQENKFHKGNGDDGKHYWLTPLWNTFHIFAGKQFNTLKLCHDLRQEKKCTASVFLRRQWKKFRPFI